MEPRLRTKDAMLQFMSASVENLENLCGQSLAGVEELFGWDEIDLNALEVPFDARFDLGRAVGVIEAFAFILGTTPKQLLEDAGHQRPTPNTNC